ncbi:hypothetical protein UY3_11588 [Chelonia mydas]|uniref:Uncharacterized protein n=1 Tax=Chelonia mydas TaxID=8469 RepID=M7BGQ4_CHEMY|nr:hypothetical protein UY3_11588 [Chelonia mydas]
MQVGGGAATTTPPLSMDSDDGVLSSMPEGFADGEDEEEEDELRESTQHTVLPNSQDLFITLTEIPSQPNEAREGTSVRDSLDLNESVVLMSEDINAEANEDVVVWLELLSLTIKVYGEIESCSPLALGLKDQR